MANALPSLNAGQCAAVPASNLTPSDESAEDSVYVHSSAECTDPSSLLKFDSKLINFTECRGNYRSSKKSGTRELPLLH